MDNNHIRCKIMKVGIIRLLGNAQYNHNNHTSLEIFYIDKLLKENGYSTEIIGKKGRTNSDVENYVDVKETNFDSYEALYVQLSPPNFFGGHIDDYDIDKIKRIADYQGKVYILCNDPRIKPLNYAELVQARFNVFESDYHINLFEEMLKDAYYVFSGKNISKFYKDCKYTENSDSILYLPYFEYMMTNRLQLTPPVKQEAQFNCIYYGDRRGSYREKKLRNLLPSNSILVGYKSDKIDAWFHKRVKNDELNQIMNKAKTSLIIGDEEHNDNVRTYRFFEGLFSNCLMAIDKEYDPTRSYIQDDHLADYLYIDNKEHAWRLSHSYIQRILDAQYEEAKRYVNQYKELNITI